MPVIDQPTHERTRIDSDFRYTSCQNKVRQPGYYMQARHYFPDGRFELRNKWIEDRMSEDCMYDLSLEDTACTGCPRQGQGVPHVNKVRKEGS